ncbi:MAG TPA: hypothetical protein VHE12_07785 [bacterium]|nr:hypothetical protein [bacterium]
MLSWFRERAEVLKLILQRPSLLWLLAPLQVLAWVLIPFPSPQVALLRDALMAVPWYAWVIAWLSLLWFLALGHWAGHHRLVAETSKNFFKAYLEHLLHQGHGFFGETKVEETYLKAKEWQRQAIEGIAIGLGPEASQRFFEKMEMEHSLTKAYRRSEERNSVEPLLGSIQAHLDELERLRLGLTGGPVKGGELVPVGKKDRGWDEEKDGSELLAPERKKRP